MAKGNAMKSHVAHGQLHDFPFAVSVGYSAPQGGEFFRLLQACLHSNNEVTWAEFIRLTQPVIAGVIAKSVRRWTGMAPADLVDDLVQDSYLKLCANDFKALREFECQHENALFGFLKVIASNVVHDHFRGHSSQKRNRGQHEETLDEVSHKVASRDSVEEQIERRILLHEVDTCLKERDSDSKSSRDAVIFWLYYRDGLTARAIAQRPDIRLSVKGVESTIHRLTRHVTIRLNGHRATRK
ncbi:MAG TPA: sigma-70 family RNA polymerase sigma factor [Candidatus Acidoferrales bacterium]|nr:sigma-70 family RNA polymerase sigma factor [Candidatus Acidoferrales bacterium]